MTKTARHSVRLARLTGLDDAYVPRRYDALRK
jgi:hypothetical protein